MQREEALADCQAHSDVADCKLYAVGQSLLGNGG